MLQFEYSSNQRSSFDSGFLWAYYLDGLPHLLLNDVDVVVVEPEISNAILDQAAPAAQNVRLIRLQNLAHQP